MSQRAARRSASNPSTHQVNRDLSAPTPIVADRSCLETQECFSVSAILLAFSRRRGFEFQAGQGQASYAALSSGFLSAALPQVLAGTPEPSPRLDWSSESHNEQPKSAPGLLSV